MPVLEEICASAITPRRLGVQDINLGAMWELIDFLCERHVQSLALLGTAGEFVHFSPAERMRMMGLAPRRSRVPVIINVSHSTLDGCVELGQAASSSGAAAVLLTPPGFYRYDDDTIRTFYIRFFEQTAIPIPILLYHIPQCLNGCSPWLFRDLLQQGVVHGIADASGDPSFFEVLQEIRRQTPFTLLAGDGVTGGDGILSDAACAIPEVVVASRKSPQLRSRVDEFLRWNERLPEPVAIREALTVRGLKPGPHAVPLSPARDRDAAEFREWLSGWLPAVLKECKDA